MSEDIELLLAGLEVSGFAELKRLVDLGRRAEAQLGRKADLAAAVAGIPDPRERLLASLDLTIEANRRENGLYAYVVLDGDAPMQAVGVWASEPDAFLAVSERDDDELGAKILPFYVDHVPERP